MMDTNIVLEQFRYFNIQADIDSICGNWAVSVEGDVVNCLYPYAILSFLLYVVDWKEIARTKVWFKHECEEFYKQVSPEQELSRMAYRKGYSRRSHSINNLKLTNQ